MKRLQIEPRKNWQNAVESKGLLYHTPEQKTYWDESVCYEFSEQEIDKIESSTNEIHQLCIQAVERVIKEDLFGQLGLGDLEKKLILHSWEKDHRSIYGRIDLCIDSDNNIKMLEYNADTPTSLLEASVIQWFWLRDRFPLHDQFNSIHEKLIHRWWDLFKTAEPIHFASMSDDLEDLTVTGYLRDTCTIAGFPTQSLKIQEIGFHHGNHLFVDLENRPIKNLFKLYPWEWMAQDEFVKNIDDNIQLIEPAWKQILSNKGILAILWEMFPDHPLLLPAFFEIPENFAKETYIKKPFFSREGQQIQVYKDGNAVLKTPGNLESSRFVYQKYKELPAFEKNYLLIGSWVIGEVAAGIGIREDVSPITQNSSRFVPHYFTKDHSTNFSQ